MTRPILVLLFGLALAVGSPASAQEWLLDDELRALGDASRETLRDGISKAPSRALEKLLDEETRNLEAIAKSELEPFGKEAWARLRAARKDGHLGRAIKEELRRVGQVSERLFERVWQEERARLGGMPDRLVYHLVDQALQRAVIANLIRLRDARLGVFRADGALGPSNGASPDRDTLRAGDLSHWLFANRVMAGGTPRFAWSERRDDGGVDVRSNLPLPNVTFWHDEARMREVLFEREYSSRLGNLKLTAAEVEGLARARAGRVEMPDAFGRSIEGLGATFTARARLTGVRADVTSRELEAHAGELGLRAMLMATVVDMASNVEANGTAVVTERGVAAHGSVRAGVGVSSSARLPIELDLRIVKLRVIPYASVHAGAMAEAHATLEVEWTGKLRFDVGASLSTGIGAGAGVVFELELGDVLKEALTRLVEQIRDLTRPIADAFMGRTWKGPSNDSGKLLLDEAGLAAAWAERGLARAVPETPEQVAARFAPVLYQRTKSRADLLRRVDYDGDWDTRNNWERAETGDATAWVYWDVKETETHWFATYAFYWPRRESVGPLAALNRHENDMGGALVVARKGAPRAREVELLLTCSGERMDAFGLARDVRWKRNEGSWNGEVRFVDEADHPWVDLERSHAQVWVEPRDHLVVGFTGRDDARPFGRDTGVVYYPTGQAQAPRGLDDPACGYGLRPMAELLERAADGAAFTTDDTVQPRGSDLELPRRLRGRVGLDDRAIPPWAWSDAAHGEYEEAHGERRLRDPRLTILEGDLFVDPARVVAVLFEPEGFSRTYVDNPHLRGAPRGGEAARTRGVVGALGDVDGR